MKVALFGWRSFRGEVHSFDFIVGRCGSCLGDGSDPMIHLRGLKGVYFCVLDGVTQRLATRLKGCHSLPARAKSDLNRRRAMRSRKRRSVVMVGIGVGVGEVAK